MSVKSIRSEVLQKTLVGDIFRVAKGRLIVVWSGGEPNILWANGKEDTAILLRPRAVDYPFQVYTKEDYICVQDIVVFDNAREMYDYISNELLKLAQETQPTEEEKVYADLGELINKIFEEK